MNLLFVVATVRKLHDCFVHQALAHAALESHAVRVNGSLRTTLTPEIVPVRARRT